MAGAPTRVLGLGNVLMGDDAAGPWVVEELLARWGFPDEVSIIDVGTPGLDLTPYLAGARVVIVVDTVCAPGSPPGEIRKYDRQALLAARPEPRISPHDPGLSDALLALTLAGSAPEEILLIGIVPGAVAAGIGLTAAVRAAVPRAARAVVGELRMRGMAPVPLPSAGASPWWEASAAFH